MLRNVEKPSGLQPYEVRFLNLLHPATASLLIDLYAFDLDVSGSLFEVEGSALSLLFLLLLDDSVAGFSFRPDPPELRRLSVT